MKKISLFLLLFVPVMALAQRQYTGQVVDSATNLPIAGVSVLVTGSRNGAATDVAGNFNISAAEGSLLQISSLGYRAQTYRLGGEADFVIRLSALADNELQQVVVVGYGTQRKIDITGSVAQINGNQIAKQGVVNPLSGLQGKVAGVQVTNSGAPGASPQVIIRGLGTFYGSVSPLYVVDGVWQTDISFLNPSDIENVSILKDASSESIYGVRGANGVVIITTKKGLSHVSVSYNGSVGVQIAQHIPKMADGEQYAQMINELSRINAEVAGTTPSILDSSQFGTGTNWFNTELRHAMMTSHQISVNGGSDKSTYNVSLGYLGQDGLLPTNNYKRFTGSFNNDIKISQYIKFGYNVIGMYSKSHDLPGTIWHDLYSAPPIISAHAPLTTANSDGIWGDPDVFGLGSNVVNPAAELAYNNATTQTYNINGNAYLDINFAKHFTWHSSVGGTYINADQQNYTPVYQVSAAQVNTQATITEAELTTKNWQVENTLTYSNQWGDHRLTALAGQAAYRNYYDETHSTLIGGVFSSSSATWYYPYATPGSVYNVSPATQPFQTYPLQEQESSYFGRATYAYKDRYTLTATLRSDADSKFTGNYGRALLPSVGAAWIVSNEDFMQNQHIFDVLKIKASWGKVGNSGIPNYVGTQTAYTAGSVIYGNSGVISPSQSVATLIPQPLTWEIGVGTDVGLEAAFLHNRLNLETDYYNKLTEHLVFPVEVLASSGTSSSVVYQNIGTVRNRGFELTLNWHDNINKDWSYSIGVNGAMNNNLFLKTDGFAGNFYSGVNAATGGQLATITQVGQPLGEFYGYKVIGIFQNQAEINSYADANGNVYQPNAQPGDFKYQSFTGVGPIGGNDRTMLGNPNPKYIYGINTSWKYKSFDLSLDLNGVADVSIYNSNKALRYGNENFTEAFYNSRWHGQGTSNTTPSVNIGGGMNYYINSYSVESGSYLRIRNIQLGYSLPNDVVEKWRFIHGLRIYVNAQNPVLFTKYSGFTPEINAGEAPGSMGIDYNVYPASAVYTFGVNLSL